MKTLYLIRHAHTPAGTPDELRPLSDLGRQQAAAMGKRITKPDRILCSTAVRTRQTADLLANPTGAGKEAIQFERRLYESTPDAYLEVVGEMPDDVSVIWLIGHNWAITSVAQALSGDGRIQMTPCTAVKMVFEAPGWSQLREGNLRSAEVYFPEG